MTINDSPSSASPFNPLDEIVQCENKRGDEACAKIASPVPSRWEFQTDFIALRAAIGHHRPELDDEYVLRTVYTDDAEATFKLENRMAYDYDMDPLCWIRIRRLPRPNCVGLSISTPPKPQRRNLTPKERKQYFDADSDVKHEVWRSLHKQINDDTTAQYRRTMEEHRLFVERLLDVLHEEGFTLTFESTSDDDPSAAITQLVAPWRGTGKPPKTQADKLAAIQAWDSMNEFDRPLLADWLEASFGSNIDGSLAVAESTFYGWHRYKKS